MSKEIGIKYFIACDNFKEADKLFQALLSYIRGRRYNVVYNGRTHYIRVISINIELFFLSNKMCYNHLYPCEIIVDADKVRYFLKTGALPEEAKNALDTETN